MNEIGRLEILRRYPVKSMRGEDLDRVFMSYSGLAGDRVHAFVDPRKKDNFPWVTAREVPEMLRFKPRFVQSPEESVRYPEPKTYRTEVETPEGARCDVQDPEFVRQLEKRWNRPLQLRFSEQGMQDSRPISVFGLPTLRLLEEETARSLDPRRSRANFYCAWSNGAPFYEEELLGRTLQIGETLKILMAKKDSRCAIINLDPETAAPSHEVLKTVVKKHGNCAGVYAVAVQEGVAAKGDPVYLL